MGEIFKRVVPNTPLEWTGERLTTATAGQVEIEHLHRYFLARALCRGQDVLDVASGEGYGAALLAQTARSVIGVEVSAEAVAHSAEVYRHPNLRFLEGDARQLPLDDGSVDAVVSFETIEHLYEHDHFLAEVRRVLRPGGRFIISSPERDTYSPSGSSANPYHVHELTRAEFSALLRDAFAHVRVLGQRPMLGSVLLSEGDSAIQSLTFEKRGPSHFEAARGLPRPVYLVAVASDQPVTDVPDSLYIETAEIGTVLAAANAAERAEAGLAAAHAVAERAEAEARARAERAEAGLAAAHAVAEKAEAEARARAERAEAGLAAAHAVAEKAEAEARARAERAEAGLAAAHAVAEMVAVEMRTKAIEDAEAARTEIAAARAEAVAACSQRDIARMAARRAAAAAEGHWRGRMAQAEADAKQASDRAEAARRAAAAAEEHWSGRMAQAEADVKQASDRAEAARTEAACIVAEATARLLSATQQLQVERTSYESENAALQREIQAIFDSTIWRASAPLRMAASWLPLPLRRAARGGLRAVYWVLTPWRTLQRINFLQKRFHQ